jgi:OmpA-OmpF porin, OOP family
MKPLSIILIFILSLGIINVKAQINIGEKIKSKSNYRANKHVDEGIDKGLDNVEDGVKGLFKKQNKEQQFSDSISQLQTQESNLNGKNQDNNSPGLAAFSKFDFVPGERVIFYEDFSQDAVGDFPALWNTNSSAEIVTTNLFPGKWMQFRGNGSIWTDQLMDLPENYTIEFDVIPIKGESGNMEGYQFLMIKSINTNSFDHGAVPGKAGFFCVTEYFGRQSYRTYNNDTGNDRHDQTGYRNDEQHYQKENNLYHISIWVQKTRVRIYQDEVKIFDLPKAFLPPSSGFDRIRFEQGAAMVSNIRIAIGTPDTRNKLMTEGKLVTYGIYFDVNKDVVKPESYGTLKDIAAILNEVPDVKVKIVGHTDSDGQDDANLDLSKRRAASVKAELSKSFGVNPDRLETDGMGESQSVAPNDTPSNKALNRRVEFVKI